jgi:hypothetical protein
MMVDLLRNTKDESLVNNEIKTFRINKVLATLISTLQSDDLIGVDKMFKSEGAFIRTSVEYMARRLSYYKDQQLLDVFLDDLRYELGYKSQK